MTFQENLRLNSNEDEQLTYYLHAVIVHSGRSASSGHYYAYVKDFQTNTWRVFNDEHISMVSAVIMYIVLILKC